MRFAQISFLYWLWAVPIVVGFLVWANRNKQKKAHTFAAPNLFQEIAADFSAKQQTYKLILLVTVFIFSRTFINFAILLSRDEIELDKLSKFSSLALFICLNCLDFFLTFPIGQHHTRQALTSF